MTTNWKCQVTKMPSNDRGLEKSSTTDAALVSSGYKCTTHKFIHLLMATFKDLHIKNSKNYKR